MNLLKIQSRVIFASALLFTLFSGVVYAHVGYIVNPSSMSSLHGGFASLLERASHDYLGILLASLGLIGLLFLFWLFRKFCNSSGKIRSILANCFSRCTDLHRDIPWMMRLGIGIALIGAGSSRVLISPVLDTTAYISLVETILGFLILAGLAISWAVVVSIIFFSFGLYQNIYLLGNLDFMALAFGILVYNDPRPGIDFIFGTHGGVNLSKYKSYVPRLLSISLGISFIFLALYEKVLYANASVLVFDEMPWVLAGLMSSEVFTLLVLLIELFLGCVFLFGKNVRFFSAFAFIFLTLSFFYFKESVSSHVTIFTILSILFITNGKKANHE